MSPFSSYLESFFSPEQLSLIRKTHVGIAGAGGLGSNCASILVRCGFERFTIVDFDLVSPSNLNRQFYFPDQIGKPKVESIRENLLRINPGLSLATFQCKVTGNNIEELFGDCDLVVEAFDNPESKAMLAEVLISKDRPVVSVSGIGGYGNADGIVSRKIKPNFYLVGDGVSEVNSTVKPYAPRVMVAAAKQADIVLSLVLGKKTDLL
ncbi:MAG TPA: sulfur carrier protein ThiS adenylyltransferase ThiF [Chitinispirillaceae bacterium]|nr:sulfur carrier protein ThiS adenylyltransferase ThiF [Chitinispirillaceae bacterium]